MVHRAKGHGNSIEEIFKGLKNCLEQEFGLKVLTFTYDNNSSVIKNALRLRGIKADIFHITGDVNYLLPILPTRKTVVTVHDVGHYKNMTGWRKLLYGIIWFRLPLSFVGKVTTVSNFSKQDLKKHFGFSKAIVVNNPLNPIFKAKPKAFDEKYPNILHVGANPHKNLEGVAEAIKGLPCKLTIIGHLTEAQKNLLQSNHIDYELKSNLSYEEVLGCYQDCDLVTFPSFHEGFGMPILEANAVGRPIVTSTVCSLPEAAGDGAAFVNPNDVVSIRSAILQIISDEEYRNQLVKNGYKNIERFTMKAIAKQYLHVYRSLHKDTFSVF